MPFRAKWIRTSRWTRTAAGGGREAALCLSGTSAFSRCDFIDGRQACYMEKPENHQALHMGGKRRPHSGEPCFAAGPAWMLQSNSAAQCTCMVLRCNDRLTRRCALVVTDSITASLLSCVYPAIHTGNCCVARFSQRQYRRTRQEKCGPLQNLSQICTRAAVGVVCTARAWCCDETEQVVRSGLLFRLAAQVSVCQLGMYESAPDFIVGPRCP